MAILADPDAPVIADTEQPPRPRRGRAQAAAVARELILIGARFVLALWFIAAAGYVLSFVPVATGLLFVAASLGAASGLTGYRAGRDLHRHTQGGDQ